MTTAGPLTIAAVRGWRLDALHGAADGFATAGDALDEEIHAVRRAMDRATRDWRGPAADAAGERTVRELRDGRTLLDALQAARDILRTGAYDLTTAQAELVATVDGAVAAGFAVADDGGVAPAPLPPVLTSPEGAAAAVAARAARESELACQAGGTGTVVSTALQAVISADLATAEALARIEVPASMQAQVDELLASLVPADPVGDAFAWSFGGVRALQVGVQTFTTGRKLLNFAGRDFQSFVYGPYNGGPLRLLLGASRARLLGKAFLPLTAASGLWDGPSAGDTKVAGTGRPVASAWPARPAPSG